MPDGHVGMQHLFTPSGDDALREVLRLKPLLAFDFDGTLADIVARPDDARIDSRVSQLLATLAGRLPLAIVTGRAVADVRPRLGFRPRYLIGNHGAEDETDPGAAALRAGALAELRTLLLKRHDELTRVGVWIEDKGASIALHFRASAVPGHAHALIHDILAPMSSSLAIFDGKMVVNALPTGAPDKAAAVHALVLRSGAGAALFAGDDINDEPVFAAAPLHWLTVRVGRDEHPSQARFCVDGPEEVALLLQRLAGLTEPPAGGQ
jgi:trehalose 6-phosphate phosphatase